MDNKAIWQKLQEKIYPKLSSVIDDAFPEFEFEFRKTSKKWVSTNTLHLSGIEGQHGKGKVSISINKPYVIGDFREGTKWIINYLIDSAEHLDVNDFKTAVEYLGKVTGVSLKDEIGSTSKKSTYSKYTPKPFKSKKTSFIPFNLFEVSLKEYQSNSFALYLDKLLGTKKAKELIEKFYIGTSKKWNGSPIFWQIDTSKKIRAGKIMGYNSKTGKRKRWPNEKAKIDWVHSILKRNEKVKNYNLTQCLFGLHQVLSEPEKNIAIVESEKTAIIATAYLPQYLWLASGALINLNRNMLKDLKGKNITLFPDKGGFELWSKKAIELSDLANFTVSDLLERKKAEKGSDLADYLIRYEWRTFQ